MIGGGGSPRRHAHALAFLGLVFTWCGAQAQSCDYIQVDSPAKVGVAAKFTLHCQAGEALQVAWEFGDTSSRTEFANSLTASHIYTEPGAYTVFARIQGEDVPVYTTISIVHPPTPVAPTHASTIVRDQARGRIFVVNPDHNTVSSLVVEGFTREFEAPVGKRPRTLALDADGNLWVVCQDDATVRVISSRDGTPIATLALPFGSRPYGIAFTPDLKSAYVTLEAI